MKAVEKARAKALEREREEAEEAAKGGGGSESEDEGCVPAPTFSPCLSISRFWLSLIFPLHAGWGGQR